MSAWTKRTTLTMKTTTTPKNSSDFVIVALDFDSFDGAKQMIDLLGQTSYFKVGMELFYSAGPTILDYLRTQNKKIFLDLKLNDIPNTIRGALRALSIYRPELFTLFTNHDGIKAALMGLSDAANDHTRLLNVTVLTSAAGQNASDEVLARAAEAQKAGAHGVVCSARETALLRQKIGDELLIVNPGIRPEGADTQDQKRVATPREAFDAGASHIVVGRPVTLSDDPAAAFDKIMRSLA